MSVYVHVHLAEPGMSRTLCGLNVDDLVDSCLAEDLWPGQPRCAVCQEQAWAAPGEQVGPLIMAPFHVWLDLSASPFSMR